MKYITIKRTKEFNALAFELKRSPDLLLEEILEIASDNENGYVVDDICGSGNLLIDNIRENVNGACTDELACFKHTGSDKPRDVELFCKLILWGTFDCPKCGGLSEDISKWKSVDINLPMEIDGIEKRKCTNCKEEFEG